MKGQLVASCTGAMIVGLYPSKATCLGIAVTFLWEKPFVLKYESAELKCQFLGDCMETPSG